MRFARCGFLDGVRPESYSDAAGCGTEEVLQNIDHFRRFGGMFIEAEIGITLSP
jgi:hypothetical protein